MKIDSSFNNIFLNDKKKDISFKAGLTRQMLQEIQNIDALTISNRLATKGIQTDFKGNKVVAWCCDKTIDIIQQFNKKFKAKLPLPKGIYVEDFRNLNDNPSAFGTCNLLPSYLRKNSDEIIPEKTLFFNSMINWDDVDKISDVNFAEKMFSSDFFLYPFLHEFSHVAHVDRLIKNFKGDKLVSKIELARKSELIKKLPQQVQDEMSLICDYALKNSLDTIACDLPPKIICSLDKNTLVPTKNLFIGTPYENLYFWQRKPKSLNKEQSLQEILRNFWDGNFD